MWLLRGQRVIQVSFRHDEVTLSSNEMVLFLFVAFAFSHSYYIRELCVGSACILEEILETNNVIKNLSVEKNCSSFFPSLELVIIAFVAMIAVELSKHLSKKRRRENRQKENHKNGSLTTMRKIATIFNQENAFVRGIFEKSWLS